jgi:hypothetical protein
VRTSGTKAEINAWKIQMRIDSVLGKLMMNKTFITQPGYVAPLDYGQEEYEEHEGDMASLQGNPYVEDGGIPTREIALEQEEGDGWML